MVNVIPYCTVDFIYLFDAYFVLFQYLIDCYFNSLLFYYSLQPVFQNDAPCTVFGPVQTEFFQSDVGKVCHSDIAYSTGGLAVGTKKNICFQARLEYVHVHVFVVTLFRLVERIF